MDTPEVDPFAEIKAAAREAQRLAEIEAKLVKKIEHVRAVAQNVARRLLNARPADAFRPGTTAQMMDVVDAMAKTPSKFGVTILPHERKKLVAWHRIARALLAKAK